MCVAFPLLTYMYSNMFLLGVCACGGGTANEADQFVAEEDWMLNQYRPAASTRSGSIGISGAESGVITSPS